MSAAFTRPGRADLRVEQGRCSIYRHNGLMMCLEMHRLCHRPTTAEGRSRKHLPVRRFAGEIFFEPGTERGLAAAHPAKKSGRENLATE